MSVTTAPRTVTVATPRATTPAAGDLLLTMLAPAAWGLTYVVTTELLPPGRPLTAAALRALPAGGAPAPARGAFAAYIIPAGAARSRKSAFTISLVPNPII